MMSCPNLNPLVWQHLFRNARLQSVWKSGRPIVRTSHSFNTETKDIVIPNYIRRGPTDILEALASTVKRDPTAAHYKFHDDPYLIPASNHAKRTYALSQEAGRKAACWIKQEHAELFQHRNAEPFIQAFAPVEKLTEATPITEDLLKKYIHTSQVENAMDVYGKLGSPAISSETRQSFLELIAFYNEEDQLNEDFIEEKWFKSGMKGKDQVRKTWKNNGFAEKLFNSMERKTPEAYHALICGMVKHGKADGAWEYYNQMLAEGFVPNLPTYNSILRAAGIVREDGEHQIGLIDETLKSMALTGTKPNVRTLNAVLESVSRIAMYRVAREKSLQVISDFKSIGVKPSLGSHYFLLRIFCREKGPISNILAGIVNILEHEMPPLQDLHDIAFFAEAMRVCSYHLEDVQLARRLHDLLCTPQNQAFIGDSFKESIYYRCFLLLLTRAESPDALMETYRHLVPNIYTPEQSVFEALVKSIAECSAIRYVPELWSDAVYMDMGERESILEVLLEALASGSGLDPKTILDKDDVDPVLATARAITAHVDSYLKNAVEKDRQISLRWTGSMLGNLTKVYLQYGDVASADAIMIKVNTLKNQLSSFFPMTTLSKFYESCVERQHSAMALMAIDYAAEMGYDEVSSMAEQARTDFKLDERQQQKLNSILGNAPKTPEES